MTSHGNPLRKHLGMVLLLYIVISIISLATAQTTPVCGTRWFGIDCKYKCHCFGTATCQNTDGQCSKCDLGWFGPACQYVDLVQVAQLPSSLAVLKDNNEMTCISTSLTSLDVAWHTIYPFTWMRITVPDPGLLYTFTVSFNTNKVPCNNLRIATVNDNTLDIHCDNIGLVTQVTLTGSGVSSLCSVYISGGRDVALLQPTSQSSTYSPFWSDKAVDGDTNGDFSGGNSCTATYYENNPRWSVRFPLSVIVNRYVLYNRNDYQDRLPGFILTSFDTNNVPVYTYTDPSGPVQTIYTVLPTASATVSNVTIQLNSTLRDKILTLCEVEIYGDTNCVVGMYGRNCEQTCNCANPSDPCFVSTGGCPSGCAAGYSGEACTEPCPSGTYGKGCSSNCSTFCNAVGSGRSACINTDGVCINGCKAGYTSPKCDTQCPSGTYGQGCSSNCSPFCGAVSSGTSVCDHVDGSCERGCKDGYISSRCDIRCNPGTYGSDCAFSCSQFCAPDDSNISNCYNINGACQNGCVSGYGEAKCDTYCSGGTFGKDCKSICSSHCVLNDKNIPECDHINGTCACQHGYQTPLCNNPCPVGKFGKDCASNCSQFCVLNKNISECNNVDGTCPCQIGYEAPWCNKSCEAGKYGQHCSSICSTHCSINSTACYPTSGACMQGCQSGYEEPLCQSIIDDNSPSSPAGAIAGAVIGAVAAILIIAVIAIILWRRRKAQSNQNNGDSSNGRNFDLMNKDSESRHSKTELDTRKNNQKESQFNENKNVDASNNQVYYNVLTDTSPTVIPLKDLAMFLTSHNKSFYQEQFSTIPTNNEATTETAQKPENRIKNRSKNIWPYDHSRVHLMSSGKHSQGDYINASHIWGYNGQESFIASQGPTEHTLEDFIRMIWEQKTEEVVMLTNLVENGKETCERYWPEDGEMKVGEITVELTTTQVFADYTIRRLKLRKDRQPDHSVTHFHFTAWHDLDVPLTPWSLVDFEQRLASYPTSKPIIVHCSAGVGRTGTFIALRNIMKQAEDKGYLDIFSSVQKLRHDRINMVQTSTQYEFLHRAAQVAILCMGTTVTSNNIQQRISYLDKTSQTGLTNMEHEFKMICNLKNDDEDDKEKNEYVNDASNVYQNSLNMNRQKNRLSNIIAKTLYAPVLQCETDDLGDYINAVFVQSFRKQNQQFLTQLPLPTTVIDFWRLVTQYNVSLIVSFEDDLKATDQTVGEYLPSNDNQAVRFSMFELETKTISTNKLWQQRKVTVTADTEYSNTKLSTSAALKEEQVLTHLKCLTTDLDPENMLTLITQIRSLNPGDNNKTMYMCRNGADYSGLVYVLSLLLDRMDNDGSCTVPLVVGAIKTVRPQVIPTLVQYEFLYQVLQLYNDITHVYASIDDTH